MKPNNKICLAGIYGVFGAEKAMEEFKLWNSPENIAFIENYIKKTYGDKKNDEKSQYEDWDEN